MLYCISSEQQLESEMNERIRELAVQILPNEKEFHQGDPKEWGYFFTGEELEKFAELLIQECTIALENNKANLSIDSYTDAIWEINEHFGLE